MSPSPQMPQNRYRQQGMQGGSPQPGGVPPVGGPAGGPPSYTGGTPSGSQPAGAGIQQRMQAPWMQGQAQAPTPTPGQPQSQVRGPYPIDGSPGMPGAAPTSGNRMPPPWAQQSGNAPQGGAGARPQYQGAPGPMQRSQMSGTQPPQPPQSQGMGMRQQAQQERNPQ